MENHLPFPRNIEARPIANTLKAEMPVFPFGKSSKSYALPPPTQLPSANWCG